MSTSQPPAERPDHHRDARPRGPRADRAATLVSRERGDDHGQRARRQQGAEHALQRAARDQDLDRRRDGADHRDDAEAADADREHAPLAVEVPERAGNEDQRAERQQVGVRHPLLAGQPAAEVVPDRRERDVDDRRIEARDERAHDRGHEGEAFLSVGDAPDAISRGCPRPLEHLLAGHGGGRGAAQGRDRKRHAGGDDDDVSGRAAAQDTRRSDPDDVRERGADDGIVRVRRLQPRARRSRSARRSRRAAARAGPGEERLPRELRGHVRAVEGVADDEIRGGVVARADQLRRVADLHPQLRRRPQAEVLAGDRDDAGIELEARPGATVSGSRPRSAVARTRRRRCAARRHPPRAAGTRRSGPRSGACRRSSAAAGRRDPPARLASRPSSSSNRDDGRDGSAITSARAWSVRRSTGAGTGRPRRSRLRLRRSPAAGHH